MSPALYARLETLILLLALGLAAWHLLARCRLLRRMLAGALTRVGRSTAAGRWQARLLGWAARVDPVAAGGACGSGCGSCGSSACAPGAAQPMQLLRRPPR